jgi:hypothetical protein
VARPVTDADHWPYHEDCLEFHYAEEILTLTAQFAVLIGTRWNDLYDGDSVQTAMEAVNRAEEFLALWESGMLETLEDADGSWLSAIDEYFQTYYADQLNEGL